MIHWLMNLYIDISAAIEYNEFWLLQYSISVLLHVKRSNFAVLAVYVIRNIVLHGVCAVWNEINQQLKLHKANSSESEHCGGLLRTAIM